MTVAQLLAEISSREISEWMVEDKLRAEEEKKRRAEIKRKAGK